ncbi:hypothetical protein [Acidovorax sp.]
MSTPMPFPMHSRLQNLLRVTACAWGLRACTGPHVRRAPRAGFAISY